MDETHWASFLGLLIGLGFPVYKIIRKAGYNGWWVVFGVVPILNLLLLWIFAFAEWPNTKRSEMP